MNVPRSLAGRLTSPLAAMAVGLSLLWMHAGDGFADAGRISVTSGEFRTPVVELYTSEGCSSCPPADNWLRKLGQSLNQNFRAVPLAFHVDYWNYLGWTDPYSQPSFTRRQREAPANRRRGGVYTPEFVVDGREAKGSGGIVRAIQKANLQKAEATIMVEVRHGEAADANNTEARIEARIDVDNQSAPRRAHAHVVIYESGITRKIGAGENRGKTLKHDFVVRHWSAPIALRHGANHAVREVGIPAHWNKRNLGLAVIVLDPGTGQTVQAVNESLGALFPG